MSPAGNAADGVDREPASGLEPLTPSLRGKQEPPRTPVRTGERRSQRRIAAKGPGTNWSRLDPGCTHQVPSHARNTGSGSPRRPEPVDARSGIALRVCQASTALRFGDDEVKASRRSSGCQGRFLAPTRTPISLNAPVSLVLEGRGRPQAPFPPLSCRGTAYGGLVDDRGGLEREGALNLNGARQHQHHL